MNKEIITIYLPNSPSKIHSTKTIKATKILYSYGGGMGGASKYIYCTEYSEYDGMYICSTIEGLTIKLNKRFVVLIEDGIILEHVTDSLDYINYKQIEYKKYLIYRYFWIPINCDYNLSDKTGRSPEKIYFIEETERYE